MDQNSQNRINLNLNILSHNNRNVRAGSLARLGHPLDVRYKTNYIMDSDGNLCFDWLEFKRWVKAKYSKQYYRTTMCYARKYKHLIYGNLRELDFLQDSTKATVVKALVVLSKFLGIHSQFKQRLQDYGIKIKRPDSFTSFLRILKNNNSDILNYYHKATEVLRSHEKLYLKFLLLTGLRKEEAIISFNKITDLNSVNRLDEYYDQNLNCLLHFKYPKEFIRKTKNCFISFVKPKLIDEIAKSKYVSYTSLRRHLKLKGLNLRLNEFRDYFGTYLLQKGILESEINLLQGRIPPSIFIKHYWSPNLKHLKNRVFEALKQLEQQLN